VSYRNIRARDRADVVGTRETAGCVVMDATTLAALQRLAEIALHRLTNEERATIRAFLGRASVEVSDDT